MANPLMKSIRKALKRTQHRVDFKPRLSDISFQRLEPLEPRLLMSGTPVISEFMAINDSAVLDEDNEYSDWLEIHNPTGAPVDLDGWYLTDDASDLTKWEFPAYTLEPEDYLVVFASDKDRDSGEFHTNFRLSGSGEFLGLVMPDGTTVAHSYDPDYPQQLPNTSYGLSQFTSPTTIIDENGFVSYFVPTGPFAGDFTQISYDDSGWSTGAQGLGFAPGGSPINTLVNTDISGEMFNVNSSVFIRNEFTIGDVNAVDALDLDVNYNDGFVAYLNGQEILRRNAPETLDENSAAVTGDDSTINAITEDFEGLFTNTLVQATSQNYNASPVGPIVVEGGPTGNYLQLTADGQNGTTNAYTFDQMTDSAIDAMTANFDFRATSTGAAAADGFYFGLASVGRYGDMGNGALSGGMTAEEPNQSQLLAVGFDLHPADTVNDISLHWAGAELQNFTLDNADIDFDAGVFHHVTVDMVEDGFDLLVTVTLTPDINGTPGASITPIDNYRITDATLYEHRIDFGARTGGLNFGLDLDNIDVDYVAAEDNASMLNADFESRPDVNFSHHKYSAQANPALNPGPQIIAGDAGSSGSFLRLIPDNIGGQNNVFAFDSIQALSGAKDEITANFDFRMPADLSHTGCCAERADGFYFGLFDTITYGHSGVIPGGGAERGLYADAFTVAFDIFNNATENTVTLNYDGVNIALNYFDPAVVGQYDFNNDLFNNLDISIVPDAINPDDARVTVNILEDSNGAASSLTTLFDDVLVPNLSLDNFDFRAGFGARSGGAFVSVDLDNVNVDANVVTASDSLVLNQDFDSPGTVFSTNTQGGGTGAAILPGDAGSDGDFIRLLQDGVGSQRNSIAFDRVNAPGDDPQSIMMDFDFRLEAAGSPADGISMLLLPTELYGRTGSLDVNYTAEEPNIPGVFALGIDVYNQALGVNDASVHWDNSEIVNQTFANPEINLDAGVFHRAHLELSEESGGTRVTFTLTPDINGAPGTTVFVADDLFIPELDLYDFRVAFAGRTGGAFMNADLDNISATVVQTPYESESIDLRDHIGLLQNGDNVLAIHALSGGVNDEDFLMQAELTSLEVSLVEPFTPLFFEEHTPGAPNAAGFTAPSANPVFSTPGGIFNSATSSISLALTNPSGTANIHYTLDGSIPTQDSPVYAGPINVNGSMIVRARAYDPTAGTGPSQVITEEYLMLDASLDTRDSDVPLVILDSMNSGIPTSGSTSFASLVTAIIDVDELTGRASTSTTPDFLGRGGMRVRGSSSAGWAKKNYAFETWDDNGEDQSVDVLGFAPESDWVLFASYLDRTLIREMLVHKLSEDLQDYAVQTRPVEVYLNTGGGKVSEADYLGTYIFMEKIKRDDNRVDVAELLPSQTEEPQITGGYIIKKDRLDPGDVGIPSTQAGRLALVDPEEDELSQEQRDWITTYIADFEAALAGPNYTDPDLGYAAYIDVDSWIDHHLQVEAAYNIDGFRLSTYMYKDRGGKLVKGPIWDYDRSLGNTTALGGTTPDGFYSAQIGGTNYPWWPRLFSDADFNQAYIDRWQELRQSTFETDHVHSIIDDFALELQESQARNFQRWDVLNTGGNFLGVSPINFPTWEEHVEHLKDWIEQRYDWIDSQYTGPPAFNVAGGLYTPGQEIVLTAPEGTIYYTLDGSDPRLSGGGISPAALVYDGDPDEIVVNENVRVRARAFDAVKGWSSEVEEIYATDIPELTITELQYNPSDDPNGVLSKDDFEFVELQNVGATPIDLTGIRFSEGIDFTFPAGPLVAGASTFEDVDSVEFTANVLNQFGAGTYGGVDASNPSDNSFMIVQPGTSGDNSDNRIAFNLTAAGEQDQINASMNVAVQNVGQNAFLGERTFHSFDVNVGTPYTSSTLGDGTAPQVLTGGATGSYLRLIHDGVNNNANRVTFDQTADDSYIRIISEFDFRASSSAEALADGFSILFLPTSQYGTSGPGSNTSYASEEPNLANTFAVGFDFHPAVDGVNDVSAHWNGVERQNVRLTDGQLDLSDGDWHHVTIDVGYSPDDGGSYVTVTLTPDINGTAGVPFSPIENLLIPGLTPYNNRVELSGRTGGLNMSVDIDNLDVQYTDGHLPTELGTSIGLISTDTYGAIGEGSKASDFLVSPPALEDAITADLRLLPGSGHHELNIYVDGAKALSLPVATADVDLTNGQFHTIDLTLNRTSNGSTLTATITPDAKGTPGTPVELVTDYLIPGLSLFESRVEVTARRGSILDAQINVDDIQVDFLRNTPNLLNPGERVVVAENATAFAQRFPGVDPAGIYGGNLDNGGEEIRIKDSVGVRILEMTYDDDAPWAESADGDGPSLELIDPSAVPSDELSRSAYLSDPANWAPSNQLDGTPDYPRSLLGDVNYDGVVDDADIDELREGIINNDTDYIYDLNRDGNVDEGDFDYMIEDILNTRSGDANLDGKVDLEDLAKLATNFGQSGKGWAEGNFTLDDVVDLADLAKLATNFGYTGGGMGAAEDSQTAMQAAASDSTKRDEALLVNTDARLESASSHSWSHIDSLLDDEDEEALV